MKKNSFTLIELMAVILIIGILMGLVSALIPQLRERSRRTQCVNNLRNIGLAIESYAQDNDLAYPFHVNNVDTSTVTKLLKLPSMEVYLKGDDVTRLSLCPSTLKDEDSYTCHNESISPNEVDERFVSAFDQEWNHIKPTYQANVLFGDGRVKSAVGKDAEACVESFNELTGHDGDELTTCNEDEHDHEGH